MKPIYQQSLKISSSFLFSLLFHFLAHIVLCVGASSSVLTLLKSLSKEVLEIHEKWGLSRADCPCKIVPFPYALCCFQMIIAPMMPANRHIIAFMSIGMGNLLFLSRWKSQWLLVIRFFYLPFINIFRVS